MNRIGSFALAAAALVCVASCVELTGQRISWFHDEAKDELRLLLYYDGIHDTGSERGDKGTEQVPKFVADGDVMLLDWPFHLQRKDLAKKIDAMRLDAAEREAIAAGLSVTAETVGWYEEPEGRVGALQHVVIPQVSKFLRAMNGAISAGILDERVPDGHWKQTWNRLRLAAEQGHQWLALDGQQIVATFPVHPAEWARGKQLGLAELVNELRKAEGEDLTEMGVLLDSLARAPVSLVDEGDRVVVRLGWRDRPCVLRGVIRDEYDPNLETVVKQEVPRALLERIGETSPALADVLEWGAPEATALALLDRIEATTGAEKSQAAAQLAEFARKWNAAGNLPMAPEGEERMAWLGWYAEVR